MANFASSDGWIPTPATPNHRRVPLIFGPMKSTATRATNVRATMGTTTRGSRYRP